jgi:hypothetical protein
MMTVNSRLVATATMTPRHAAALALVGWYLVIPPWDKQHVFGGTPLSQWTDYEGSYDTAKECAEGKEQLLRDVDAEVKKYAGWQSYKDAVILGRCVATDDPRLKEK